MHIYEPNIPNLFCQYICLTFWTFSPMYAFIPPLIVQWWYYLNLLHFLKTKPRGPSPLFFVILIFNAFVIDLQMLHL